MHELKLSKHHWKLRVIVDISILVLILMAMPSIITLFYILFIVVFPCLHDVFRFYLICRYNPRMLQEVKCLLQFGEESGIELELSI